MTVSGSPALRGDGLEAAAAEPAEPSAVGADPQVSPASWNARTCGLGRPSLRAVDLSRPSLQTGDALVGGDPHAAVRALVHVRHVVVRQGRSLPVEVQRRPPETR